MTKLTSCSGVWYQTRWRCAHLMHILSEFHAHSAQIPDKRRPRLHDAHCSFIITFLKGVLPYLYTLCVCPVPITRQEPWCCSYSIHGFASMTRLKAASTEIFTFEIKPISFNRLPLNHNRLEYNKSSSPFGGIGGKAMDAVRSCGLFWDASQRTLGHSKAPPTGKFDLEIFT